jgi:hypothetical protein
MRRTMLLLAIFGLAGSLWAADPIIGTWKLNIEKSKFSSARHAMLDLTAPKEQTEVYRELDSGRIELTWKNTASNGSTATLVFIYPLQGGAVKVEPSDTPITWVQIRVAEREWYATYIYEGKQLMTRHKVISKDGKTMYQTLRGIDDAGKPFEVQLVLDNQ